MSSVASETAQTASSGGGDDLPLDQLKAILKNQDHQFACGGTIPIVENSELARPVLEKQTQYQSGNHRLVDEPVTSEPITIRWDVAPKDEDPGRRTNTCAKITLPLAAGSETDIQQLLEGTQAATFGRGGEDVYDETYRKALKMDTTAFSSTFDPYSLGIIDTIAQVLLPSVIDSSTLRAVRAELYKLNVYTGPSGKFKNHVDTPRSPSQFGSLVICLPLEHEGGLLKVRHKTKEMTYDWSTSREEPDHATIRWAAFYSDCEHEILEVTSGHRLTLTYNLYAVRGTGRLTGVSQVLDPTHLPLYQAVEATLTQDLFDGKGGTLGFWCSHAYAYNDQTETLLPDTLKGVDAMLWEVFQKLDLKPTISPIVKPEGYDAEYLQEWYEEKNPEPLESDTEAHKLWEANKPTSLVIGNKFGVHFSDWEVEGSGDYYQMFREWGNFLDERTEWLTTPASKSELQLAYTAYGNEATTETLYSKCAIMVNIPPRDEEQDDDEQGEGGVKGSEDYEINTRENTKKKQAN